MLKIIECLINGSKSIHKAYEFLKIIRDRGITLLESCKLEMNLHNLSPRVRGEQVFKSEPEIIGSCTLEHVSDDGLC